MSTKTLTLKKAQIIIGEYYLHDVPGTISSIKFNDDATFDFYYSYSAIDRSGSGTYKIKDNRVILNGPQRLENDFNLVNNKRNSHNGITIKIIDSNPMMRRYVSCCIATTDGMQRAQTDEEGIAHFQKQAIHSILLIHLLFPDRTSIFKVKDISHNYFEFEVEPSIANVYFNNLSLKINKDELSGAHPLLDGNQFHYSKKK